MAFLTKFEVDQINHVRKSTRKYRYSDFLLPVGGTVTVIEYWQVDVFRAGH